MKTIFQPNTWQRVFYDRFVWTRSCTFIIQRTCGFHFCSYWHVVTTRVFYFIHAWRYMNHCFRLLCVCGHPFARNLTDVNSTSYSHINCNVVETCTVWTLQEALSHKQSFTMMHFFLFHKERWKHAQWSRHKGKSCKECISLSNGHAENLSRKCVRGTLEYDKAMYRQCNNYKEHNSKLLTGIGDVFNLVQLSLLYSTAVLFAK